MARLPVRQHAGAGRCSPSSCALVVGAVFIVVSDEPTRTAMGYFTQHPGDTFSRGWHAISAAYSQLFEGSILNRELAVLQRRRRRPATRSRTR